MDMSLGIDANTQVVVGSRAAQQVTESKQQQSTVSLQTSHLSSTYRPCLLTFVLGSPLHNTCKKTAPPKTKQKRAKAKEPKPSKTWMTDQNWQGQSHQRLRVSDLVATASRRQLTRDAQTFLENVFKKLSASRASFGSAVYRFNLVTVNDAKEKHASWVEANGSKRFCVGPGALGAENNRGCTSDLVKGADYP